MKRHFLLSMIFGVSCLSLTTPVRADDTDEQSSDYPNAISSIDAIGKGRSSTNGIARAAEYCVQNEQYDKAIKLSRRAIDQNDDDSEMHQVYAEALEGKLRSQAERDPMIFNQCVKEWLIVLRQEVGDEKQTYHGIGIPLMGHMYADDERVIPARKHLLKLTGHVPKVWETDDKFLKKVLLPGNANVRGAVVTTKSEKPAPPENAD